MRGLAVLVAVAAAWVLSGGALPRLGGLRRPRIRRTFLLLAPPAGLACGVLALGLTGVGSVAAGVGTLVAGGVLAAGVTGTGDRAAAALGQWTDLLALVRGELAGGRSLPEAFLSAAERVGPPLSSAGREAALSMAAGATFPEAMAELRRSFEDPVADRVLVTMSVAHRTGGHRVGEMLSSLAMSIADDLRLRSAHDAALTEQRLTAAVALVAPWALLVLTVATNPTAALAYGSPTGQLIVAVGLGTTVAGYGLARRTARLSRAPRIFR